MTVPPAVRARGLTKRYGEVVAVAGFDAEIAQGETVAITGPAGCGKTTLLRLISGQLVPTAGDLSIAGLCAYRHAARIRASAALVSREPVNERDAVDFRRLLADVVPLSDLAAARVAARSAGIRQRIAIARALSRRPRLLLLDEPTVRLAAPDRDAVLEGVTRMGREGITVLMVTGDAAALGACNRAIVLTGQNLPQPSGAR
ncbi:ABC transporter ATP-binding protein [Micromonospora chokoriensis]